MAGRAERLLEDSSELIHSGNTADALQIIRQALDIALTEGDHSQEEVVRITLGDLYFRLDQITKVQEQAELILRTAEPRGENSAEAFLLLARCASRLMQLESAQEYLAKANDIARENGFHMVRIRALFNLASEIYAPRGQFDIAIASCQEVFRLASEKELRGWIWGSLVTTGWCAWLAGKLDVAEEAAEKIKEVTLPGSIPMAWHNFLIANLRMELGSSDVSDLLQEAFNIAEKSDIPSLSTAIRLSLSRAARMRGANAEALAWSQDGLAIISRIPFDHLMVVTHIELARAVWGMNILDSDTEVHQLEVEGNLKRAIEISNPAHIDYHLALAQLLLAEFYRQIHHPDAVRYWNKAVRLIFNNGYLHILDQERTVVYPLLAEYMNHPEHAALCRKVLNTMQRSPFLPLHVHSLGGLAVQVGLREVPASALRFRRAGELLCLLLLSPGFSMSVDELAEILSPNKPLDFSHSVLHKATSALRHALEPDLPDRRFPSRYLEVQDNRVCIHLPFGSKVDFIQLRELFDRENWQGILDLYNGELLPEFRYNEWIMSKRAWIDNIYHHALIIEAQKYYDAGNWHAGYRYASCLLDEDPIHEQAAWIAMRSAFQMGNRSESARIYLRLENSLFVELGINPREELKRFYQDLNSRLSS